MDNSPSTIGPLLLRNLLTWSFIHADKSLFFFSEKFQVINRLRSLIVSAFLFFLGLLPCIFSSLIPNSPEPQKFLFKSTKDDQHLAAVGGGHGGDSGVSRALSQLLLIMNDIPVSSRKYEVVRSLVEKLIDENLLEGNRALREVNCAVLSAAFARSLSELEVAMVDEGRVCGDGGDGGGAAAGGSESDYIYKAGRLIKGVKYYGGVAWRYAAAMSRSDVGRVGCSADKVAAELLWLAQKMAASGCAEEAVCKWASASNLAWLALSTEPRLQCSLVKASAFLIKQAKDVGEGEEVHDEMRRVHIRQVKLKMLMSWLPLLCRANNGTDAPILSMAERAGLENILEDMIGSLGAEEQETILSLWLHHFTYCSVSDWPNLRSSYTRWYSGSRTRLVRTAQLSKARAADAAVPEPTFT